MYVNYYSYLEHHGVKGMRWGVRRTPQQLGRNLLKKSKTANLEKWGTDKDHNVLYIGGYSGSGKSTIANYLSSKKCDTIHLDSYFWDDNKKPNDRCPAFDSYLRTNRIKPPYLFKEKDFDNDNLFKQFENAIESFGIKQYSTGRKVIAEGTQIVDTGIRPDKRFFSDKPILILSTNMLSSMARAHKRDGSHDAHSISEKLTWYSKAYKQLSQLEQQTAVKRGKQAISKYL